MIGQSVSRRRQPLFSLSIALLSACAVAPTNPQVGWSQAELSLESECQQGKIAACGELGRSLLIRSQPSTRERERGLVLLETACGQNDKPSCTSLGMFYVGDDRPDTQARARDILSRMCDQEQAEACRGMARVRRVQDPLDTRGARAFLDKACRLGDAEACESLATAQLGDDFSGNRAQAMEALNVACAQGRHSSCFRLARVLMADANTRQEGLRRMITNCEQGHATSCVVAAFPFAPLLVDRPHCAEAVKYAQRACVAENEDGCAIVEACRPIPPGDTGRMQHLEWACERRSAMACLYWADLQQSGPGPHAEPARIQTAYAVACRGLGEITPVACVRAAILDLPSAKRPSERDELVAFLRRACESHSSGEACCTLGQAYLEGEMIPKDQGLAKDLRNRGCDLGRKECCAPLP